VMVHVPHPAEAYLKAVYGDFSKPRRTDESGESGWRALSSPLNAALNTSLPSRRKMQDSYCHYSYHPRCNRGRGGYCDFHYESSNQYFVPGCRYHSYHRYDDRCQLDSRCCFSYHNFFKYYYSGDWDWNNYYHGIGCCWNYLSDRRGTGGWFHHCGGSACEYYYGNSRYYNQYNQHNQHSDYYKQYYSQGNYYSPYYGYYRGGYYGDSRYYNQYHYSDYYYKGYDSDLTQYYYTGTGLRYRWHFENGHWTKVFGSGSDSMTKKCISQISHLGPKMQKGGVCCPRGGTDSCNNQMQHVRGGELAVPKSCSAACAKMWLPFYKQCGQELLHLVAQSEVITTKSARTVVDLIAFNERCRTGAGSGH